MGDDGGPQLTVQTDAHALAQAIISSPSGMPTPSSMMARLADLTDAMEARKNFGLGKVRGANRWCRATALLT